MVGQSNSTVQKSNKHHILNHGLSLAFLTIDELNNMTTCLSFKTSLLYSIWDRNKNFTDLACQRFETLVIWCL